MKFTISIARLSQHRACDLDKRIREMSDHLGRVPAGDEEIDITTWWALPSTSVQDRWWSLRATNDGARAKRIAVAGACLASRRALPHAGSASAAALAAIEAAEAWLADPSEERRVAAADAANAAYAAERAAANVCAAACAAARAAASAARAASACADDADTYAAYAAYSADAYAYTYAAGRADERETQRADLDRLVAEGAP